MKKVMATTILALVLVATLVPNVLAVTSATLADEIYALGAQYGMRAEHKVRIERYFNEHPVDDAKAQAVLDIANEAAAYMARTGKTNYKELNKTDIEAMKAYVIEAGKLVNVRVEFDKDGVIFYDANGKIIDALDKDLNFRYTGNGVNAMYFVVPCVAVIALALAFVAKKNIADAQR